VNGRDATVRITDDSLLFAVNLVMVVTGKSRYDAGRVIRGLNDEIFQSTKFGNRSMPGKGMGRTKLLKFEEALELIMVLPGKISRCIAIKWKTLSSDIWMETYPSSTKLPKIKRLGGQIAMQILVKSYAQTQRKK
jgi:hypothetical protein